MGCERQVVAQWLAAQRLSLAERLGRRAIKPVAGSMASEFPRHAVGELVIDVLASAMVRGARERHSAS